MSLDIELRCILFPLITLIMFLQLDWSPPVVNLIDWTWFGKAHICLYKGPTVDRNCLCMDKGIVCVWTKELSVYGQRNCLCMDKEIVSRLRSGEGYQNVSAALKLQEHSWRCLEPPRLFLELARPVKLSNRGRRAWSGRWLEPDRTSLERPENSCAATLPIQPDRVWEVLQRRMGETLQIQVCQACSVIPKMTRGCNRCQRCFNKVQSKGSEY